MEHPATNGREAGFPEGTFCPACGLCPPLVGEFPNTLWVRQEQPTDLFYDCPNCGIRIREVGSKMQLAGE